MSPYLGGGNSNIFGIFTPNLGEDEPILTIIFFKGVETTNYSYVYMIFLPTWMVEFV